MYFTLLQAENQTSKIIDNLFIYYYFVGVCQLSSDSRDRIVVSTSRCGRDNPGSNPGHAVVVIVAVMAQLIKFFFLLFFLLPCHRE